mmetsp:Transcript_47768/g.119375  ORF Transcript_47768/g.119375 Transcript_47768/m.119375 type:complete len:228 (+) Transcript_47768:592-1275(+)
MVRGGGRGACRGGGGVPHGRRGPGRHRRAPRHGGALAGGGRGRGLEAAEAHRAPRRALSGLWGEAGPVLGLAPVAALRRPLAVPLLLLLPLPCLLLVKGPPLLLHHPPHLGLLPLQLVLLAVVHRRLPLLDPPLQGRVLLLQALPSPHLPSLLFLLQRHACPPLLLLEHPQLVLARRLRGRAAPWHRGELGRHLSEKAQASCWERVTTADSTDLTGNNNAVSLPLSP